MATDASYAEFVVDQAGAQLGARVGRMFGEYALYVGEKVVGFLCDNRTLLKPTEPGRAFFEIPEVGRPYPGAKDYWVADEVVEEAPRFQELLRATANALPPAKRRGLNQPRSQKPNPLRRKPPR